MDNKSKIIFYASLVGIAGMLTLNACNVQDWIVVDAPKAVVDIAEVEGKMTLAEVDKAWADWEHFVTTNTKYFQEAVADAENRYATIHSVFNMGLGVAGEASNSFPYGGLLFGALTGFAGLMLPTPKFSKKKEEPKKE